MGLVAGTKFWSLRLDFEAVHTMRLVPATSLRLVAGTSCIVCADLKADVLNKNKTQTVVTSICLNCITFINLTFRMLQHTSSEVIITQLPDKSVKFSSKIQRHGLGTNEI